MSAQSELQGIDADGGAHGAAQVQRADVGALRGGGLRLVDGVHQGLQVLLELLGAEGDLADGAVDDSGLVQTILNLTSLDVVCVATPDMMGLIGRIGRILGPKGLMPNPKSGTVTMDVTKAISEIKAGKVEYRLDKTAIIHCPIGKVSFGAEKLGENLQTLMDAINKAKPAAAKGTYVRSVYLSSTMGPAVRVNPLKF